MGLDIYFHKRPLVDVNKEARDKLITESDVIDKELNSRGETYYKVYDAVQDMEIVSQRDNPLKDEIEKLSAKIKELDPDGSVQKQIADDKPKWDRFSELGDEIEKLNIETEVAYFRKVNFLLPFFGYDENLSDKEITKEDVEDLIVKCRMVLEKKSQEFSEETLPTSCGFFFGSTDYDEYYYSDVEYVRSKFECVLQEVDWGNEKLIMNCWW